MTDNSGLKGKLAGGTRKPAADVSRETELPDPPELEELPEDITDVPVHVALLRIAREIGAVAKGDRFDGGERGGKYNFRGVDRVVNAVTPYLNRHRVLMLPLVRSVEYRDVQRSGGGRSHECVVQMQYTFIGPRGDQLPISTQGEALDTSDKATAKAQSVAWRTAIIQAFHLATQDEDPDAARIERGDAERPKASSYVEEIANPATGVRRLQQIRHEINQHNLGADLVTNEVGDEEQLGAMLRRIGQERQQAGQQ